MIYLGVQTLGPYMWLTVILWLAAAAVAGRLWGLLWPDFRRRFGHPLLVLAAVVVLFVAWLAPPLDVDEMEHLHCAWLISQGEWPFVDFWQHHTPTLWVLVAPIVGRMPHNATICDLGRAMSLGASALAVLLALLLARRLHGPGMTAPLVVLALGAVIPSQLYDFRPDLFANVCSLSALVLLARSRGPKTILLSGLLLGAAVSLTPKHAPFAVVLPGVLASEALWAWWVSIGLTWSQLAGSRRIVKFDGRCIKRLGILLWPAAWRSALHALGVAAGIAPIVLWLHAHDLLNPFRYWVMEFNQDDYLRLGGEFPVIPLALLALWAWRARLDQWLAARPVERLAMVAAIAAAGVLVVQPFHKLSYDLQVFFLVAGACGVVEARQLINGLFSTRRPALAGVLIGVYFLPTYLCAIAAEEEQTYIRNRAEVGAVLNAIGDGEVVAVPPAHPILAHDATDLSQAWQWDKWIYVPAVRNRLRHIATEIIQERPVLVRAGGSQVAQGRMGGYARTKMRWQFVETLVEARVIEPLDGFKLLDFLEANYNLVLIMDHYHWLRADRPVPPEAKLSRKAGSKD